MDNSAPTETSLETLDRKKSLKILLDDTWVIKKDMPHRTSVETLESINKILYEADRIIMQGPPGERLTNTNEMLMEVSIIQSGHNIVSQILQSNSVFNANMFIFGIKQMIIHDDNYDWSTMANMACRCAKTVRAKPSMMGAIKLSQIGKVVKVRQSQKRSIPAQELHPEEINRLARQDNGAEKVNILHSQLLNIWAKENSPIPLYKLIINPNNMMQTVENAIQLSFLARDNIIAIETGADNRPTVRETTPTEREATKDTKHFICKVDEETCQEMIRYYNIRKPMLQISTEEAE